MLNQNKLDFEEQKINLQEFLVNQSQMYKSYQKNFENNLDQNGFVVKTINNNLVLRYHDLFNSQWNTYNKNDDFIVKGCQSKVWLFAQEEDQRVIFHADSNTVVTKGLVSLLVRVLSGHRAEEILNEDIYFPDKIGMGRFIGSQRSNGFSAMIKQMKLYALTINIKDKK